MATAFVLVMGSCAYDPNYMVGASYGGDGGGYAYGEGYGYGYSGFSTSLFISTGDARWGYDPYCNSYYDYHRRCYYDPYLYGYYPMGYRPLLVVGVPHPYGYSRSFCPPPTRVTNVTLTNYHNREAAYRNTSYSWAHQVHQQSGNYRVQGQSQPKPTPYQRPGNANYPGKPGPTPATTGYSRPATGNSNYRTGENPALRRPSGQAASSGVPVRPTSSGNPNVATGVRRAPSGPSQGSPQVRGGGSVPQAQARPQAPAEASKCRGAGQGKDGRDDKEGGGRSGR